MTIKIDSLKTENYYPGARIATRFGGTSRGKCWGRMGRGDSAEWAEKDDRGRVILPRPGTWTVGSDDGFRRKDQGTYVVVEEPPVVADDQIAEIRAGTTTAEVIEACDAALGGDEKALRRLSRVYAEAVAADRARLAAARKAERAARAEAEAAARAAASTTDQATGDARRAELDAERERLVARLAEIDAEVARLG